MRTLWLVSAALALSLTSQCADWTTFGHDPQRTGWAFEETTINRDNGRIYGSTADGHLNPAAGDYSNTVIAASVPDLNLLDYYLPSNWDYLRRKDLDMDSAGPVYFGWKDRREGLGICGGISTARDLEGQTCSMCRWEDR